MRKKFLIAGASTYYVKNHGDDAMLLNLIQGLRKKFKNCEIVLIARHPNKNLDKIYKIKSIKNFDHKEKPKDKERFFFGFNKNDETHHLKKIREYISKTDLVILGGNLFMEIFPNKFLRGISSYTALLVILARFYNKPVSLYGVNVVNQIKNKYTLDHVRFILGSSKKISVREISAKKIIDKVKASSGKIKVYGDPAFGIKFKKYKLDVIKILKKNNIIIPNNKNIIGICIREEYWKLDKKKQKQKFKRIAQILDKFQKKTDCSYLFIPNCFYKDKNKWQDDRVVHKNIKKYQKNKNNSYLINNELTLLETVNLFSLLSMHITNRRHSMVFAALNNVSSVVIKDNSGDMLNHQSSVANELGMKNNIINIQSNPNLIYSNILRIWKNKSKMEKTIRLKIKKLINKSRKQVSYITEDV